MHQAKMGVALAEANSEILKTRRAALRRRSVEHAYRLAIAATDWVIGQLEVRNLAGEGGKRLGKADSDELERVLEAVPASLRPRLRARSVQGALDTVLDMQEPLFEMRARVRGDGTWHQAVGDSLFTELGSSRSERVPVAEAARTA